MRTPTSADDALAWHRSALAGLKPPIHGEPECGWFQRKLVRGGPFVGARIWLHQVVDPDTGELLEDERFLCVVDGQMRDAVDQWTYLAGNPVSEAQYRYLVSLSRYAKAHDPVEPLADPKKKIDRMTFPLPLFDPPKKERRQ